MNNITLGPTTAVNSPGTVISQIISIDGLTMVDKASLDLTLTRQNRYETFIENSGDVFFQASNFQSSRHSWIFQPKLHWTGPTSWNTSGMAVCNAFQENNYDTIEAASDGPYLEYHISFTNPGTYDFWGFGYTTDPFYWSFNGDITNLRSGQLGGILNIPEWVKIGTIFIENAGIYIITIYLSKTTPVLFDQWCLTKNDFSFDASAPINSSVGPFMTVARLRPLSFGKLSQIGFNGVNSGVSAWLSSNNIAETGKFNYEIRQHLTTSGVSFTDGMSLEFFQVGGSDLFYTSWNYSFPNTSVGNTYISTDYGKNFS